MSRRSKSGAGAPLLPLDAKATHEVAPPWRTGYEEVDAAAGITDRPRTYEELVAYCARFGETPASCPQAWASLPAPPRPPREGYVWTMLGEERCIIPRPARQAPASPDALEAERGRRAAAARIAEQEAKAARLAERARELAETRARRRAA